MTFYLCHKNSHFCYVLHFVTLRGWKCIRHLLWVIKCILRQKYIFFVTNFVTIITVSLICDACFPLLLSSKNVIDWHWARVAQPRPSVCDENKHHKFHHGLNSQFTWIVMWMMTWIMTWRSWWRVCWHGRWLFIHSTFINWASLELSHFLAQNFMPYTFSAHKYKTAHVNTTY